MQKSAVSLAIGHALFGTPFSLAQGFSPVDCAGQIAHQPF
jgi:hypothetical protein